MGGRVAAVAVPLSFIMNLLLLRPPFRMPAPARAYHLNNCAKYARNRPFMLSAASFSGATASLPALPPAAEVWLPRSRGGKAGTDDVAPILFDSPHSGRLYDPILPLWRPVASLQQLRQGEDAWVDELVRPACHQHGITLVAQHYPRCFLDVNRADDDIDEALLKEPWPLEARPSEKSQRGLGLIRRFVRPGVPIYEEDGRGALEVHEVLQRLQHVYWPYHGAVSMSLRSLCRRYRSVLHVNWHSMKSRGNAMTPDGEQDRPDFVVSDGEGRTASPEVSGLIVHVLERRHGCSVGVNSPYKGGFLVRTHGRAGAVGVQSVQVEVNRALYMDEQAVALKPQGWARLQAVVADLAHVLATDMPRHPPPESQ